MSGVGGWRPLNDRDPAAEAAAASAGTQDSARSSELPDVCTMPGSEPAPGSPPKDRGGTHSEEPLGETQTAGDELGATPSAEAELQGHADDSGEEDNWEEELEAAAVRAESKKGYASGTGLFRCFS